jgi:Nanos RNA binding domain
MRSMNNNQSAAMCKVCYDAGKSMEMYMSHRVKEGGVVVCATLKSVRCVRCEKQGHTVKYCTVVLKKSVGVAVSVSVAPVSVAVVPLTLNKRAMVLQEIPRPRNIYENLSYKPVSVVKAKKEEEYPALSAKSVSKSVSEGMDYKRILKTPVKEVKEVVEKRECVVDMCTVKEVKAKLVAEAEEREDMEVCKEIKKILGIGERREKIEAFNKKCFRGLDGLSWMDILESDDEEYEFDSEEEIEDGW